MDDEDDSIVEKTYRFLQLENVNDYEDILSDECISEVIESTTKKRKQRDSQKIPIVSDNSLVDKFPVDSREYTPVKHHEKTIGSYVKNKSNPDIKGYVIGKDSSKKLKLASGESFSPGELTFATVSPLKKTRKVGIRKPRKLSSPFTHKKNMINKTTQKKITKANNAGLGYVDNHFHVKSISTEMGISPGTFKNTFSPQITRFFHVPGEALVPFTVFDKNYNRKSAQLSNAACANLAADFKVLEERNVAYKNLSRKEKSLIDRNSSDEYPSLTRIASHYHASYTQIQKEFLKYKRNFVLLQKSRSGRKIVFDYLYKNKIDEIVSKSPRLTAKEIRNHPEFRKFCSENSFSTKYTNKTTEFDEIDAPCITTIKSYLDSNYIVIPTKVVPILTEENKKERVLYAKAMLGVDRRLLLHQDEKWFQYPEKRPKKMKLDISKIGDQILKEINPWGSKAKYAPKIMILACVKQPVVVNNKIIDSGHVFFIPARVEHETGRSFTLFDGTVIPKGSIKYKTVTVHGQSFKIMLASQMKNITKVMKPTLEMIGAEGYRMQIDGAGGHGYQNKKEGKPPNEQLLQLHKIFADNGCELFKQPPNSPDLNYLDLGIWYALECEFKKKVDSLEAPTQKNIKSIEFQMWNVLKEAFWNISPKTIWIVCEVQKYICEEIIKNNGDHIGTQVHAHVRQLADKYFENVDMSYIKHGLEKEVTSNEKDFFENLDNMDI